MRRIVVTGMGLVTPLGIGLENVWGRLLGGESGIRAIQSFDVSDLPARIAAQVPKGEKSSGFFNADDWIPPKDQRRMDDFIVYAMAAAAQAVEDAGWQPTDEEERERTGVMIGSGIGGLPGITEAAICRLGIAGFAAARALSTNFNDDPPRASRPWDEARDGFVMGEGAGILVLEEYEHAKNRGAKIYAEVIGYGMSGDAFHLTAPAEDGNGAFRSMRNALRSARLSPDKIDYINAHGTSTPLGDEIELGAVKRLFGDHSYKLSMSSTKSAIGHLLGAAGSVEAIYSILALREGVVPPTLNLENPSPSCNLDLVPKTAQERRVRYVLSNSFGFGGTNASLIFGGAG